MGTGSIIFFIVEKEMVSNLRFRLDGIIFFPAHH